ncbi:MAG: MFS transporter [Pseudomonadota bacterium]|nr:MFS transporter [Pseudomonadota bacterium]
MTKHYEDDVWPSPIKGWYVTFVFLIAFVFSLIDRQILNLLVIPIQKDLSLSDTQISLLQGLAFVVTYVTMSVPFGRLIDKFNRVRIMISGVIIWSVTTFACGLSRSFGELMVARMGVGAGEAALSPAAWSILADYFKPENLSLPISIYLMGPYIGAGLAMILGAQVLDLTAGRDTIDVFLLGSIAPWQLTFIVVALPGIIITALLLTVREPERKNRKSQSDTVPSWSEVLSYMKSKKRIYLSLHVATPFLVVMLYGLQGWSPTILVRVFDFELSSAGRIYGIIALLFGSAGVLTGPVLARLLKYFSVNAAGLKVCVFGVSCASLSLVALPFQDNSFFALFFIALASFCVPLPLALVTTMMQEVTPNSMRGVVNGMYVVSTNVIGLALGPSLVALGTDYIFKDPKLVAYSLGLVAAIVGPIGSILFSLGIKQYHMNYEV